MDTTLKGHDFRGIQPGDRVRLTYEGEVEHVYGPFGLLLVDSDYRHSAGGLISVEKITPPLPTTPGSVIRTARYTWGLTKQGWIPLDSASKTVTYYSPEGFNGTGVDVIFDAGAK